MLLPMNKDTSSASAAGIMASAKVNVIDEDNAAVMMSSNSAGNLSRVSGFSSSLGSPILSEIAAFVHDFDSKLHNSLSNPAKIHHFVLFSYL